MSSNFEGFAAMTDAPVRWDDFTHEEQRAIEIMAGGPHSMLTVAVADQLRKLGLVDENLGGPVLNDAGRKLLFRGSWAYSVNRRRGAEVIEPKGAGWHWAKGIMTRKSPRTTTAGERSLKQMAADIIETATRDVRSSGQVPEFDDILGQAIDRETPNFAAELHSDLMKQTPSLVGWRRRHETGFRRRNMKRWRVAFNLLEAEWAVAQEANTSFFEDERIEAAAEDDHLFEALTNLHARALLVARETICLLEGGFPDGAMSRWRTIHEFNVIAHFLLLHGADVARLYLASARFQTLKHAKHAQQYAKSDPSAAIEAEMIGALEKQFVELRLTLGLDLSDDYAWAAATLAKKRPNLFDLERATEWDYWRPRVRWASRHIHGAHVRSRGLLGMAEAEKHVAMLIGPSNGGMVDPMQMLAHSLADVSEALLSSKPDILRKVAILVLRRFADDVGSAAMECQESFRRQHGYDPAK